LFDHRGYGTRIIEVAGVDLIMFLNFTVKSPIRLSKQPESTTSPTTQSINPSSLVYILYPSQNPTRSVGFCCPEEVKMYSLSVQFPPTSSRSLIIVPSLNHQAWDSHPFRTLRRLCRDRPAPFHCPSPCNRGSCGDGRAGKEGFSLPHRRAVFRPTKR
jgi:hypothetical protein